MSQETVTVRKAAEVLGVHVRVVYDWIKKGHLKAHRHPSGRLRIPAIELLRLKEKIEQGGRDEGQSE